MNIADFRFTDPAAGGVQGEDAVDLRLIRDFFKRRWKVILAVILATMTATLAFVLTVSPRYTATAEILLDPAGRKAFGESILPDFSLETANVDSQISVLRSVNLLRHAVEKLDLAHDSTFGQPPKPHILTRIMNVLRSLDHFGAQSPPPDADPAGLTAAELIAIGNLSEALEVQRYNRTYVLSVSITTDAPWRAARVANAVADVYIADQLAARYEGARRASAWLAERMEAISRQVRDSEQAVSDFRREHNLISASNEGKLTIGEQQLSEMNAKLAELRTQTAEARAKYEQAAATLRAKGSMDAIPEVVRSPVIAQLRSQEAEVARREAELRSRYAGDNPQVANVVAEHAAIRRSIGFEAERIVANLKNDDDITQAREDSLKRSIDQASAANGLDDAVGVRLRELERINAANKAMYEYFQTRSKIAQEQSNFEQPEARLISPATDPVIPSFPKKTSAEALAMIVGALLGIVVAVALDLSNNGFLTAREIEDRLDLPVLGAAPALSARARTVAGKLLDPAAYGAAKPLSRYAEAIRGARVGLQMESPDKPPKLVLVTSTAPREGKTTTAIALALSAQKAGVRVALVDADLRHPAVTSHFGLGGRPGLSDLLSGKASKDEIFLEINGLTIIPAGAKTTMPPDLLGSGLMRRYLSALRGQFDLVLIDAPPVAPVIDARLLAQLADKIVYVVRWRKSPREIVAQCVEAVRGEGKVAGVLLNQIDERHVPHHGRYAHYAGRNYSGYYEG